MANNFPELTPEIIEKLKKRYPDRPLFSIDIHGLKAVFTHLISSDVRELASWSQSNPSASLQEFDEKVVQLGMLWPELSPVQWSALPAGIIPLISQSIQDKSLMNIQDLSEAGIVIQVLSDFVEKPRPSDEELKSITEELPYPTMLVGACGDWFVVRPIMRVEFNAVRNKANADPAFDYDQEIARVCTIYPKSVNWTKLPAGVPALLCRQITDLSGFNEAAAVVSEL